MNAHLKTGAVESTQLYGSNEFWDQALDIKLNPNHPIWIRKRLLLSVTDLPGWRSKVGLRHPNIWSIVGPVSSSVLSLSGTRERTAFSRSWRKLFPLLSEKKTTLPFPEQFISLLDKTPCYIYTTKIADDILPAAPLCSSMAHGPVNHASYNRTGLPEQWNPQRKQQGGLDRRKLKEESQRGEEKPNSYYLCWLAFVVSGSEGTQQRKWNYWAFIM